MRNAYDEQVEKLLASRGVKHPYCGFSVGAGWFPIVERALDGLAAHGEVRLAQVKEKFGGLRIYIDSPEWSDEVAKIVDDAEAEAWKTCEDCGATEGVETKGPGWIRTLCPRCRS